MGGGGVLYLIIYSIVENVPRGTYYFGCGVGIITSPSSRFTFIIPYIPNPPPIPVHPSFYNF